MSRQRWILHPKTGKLVPAAEYQRERVAGPIVIKDIGEYRSIIDNSVIGGRSQHREHLRRHNCIEIGNEKIKPPADKPLPDVRPDVQKAFAQMRSK